MCSILPSGSTTRINLLRLNRLVSVPRSLDKRYCYYYCNCIDTLVTKILDRAIHRYIFQIRNGEKETLDNLFYFCLEFRISRFLHTISENTLPVYIGLSFFVAILFTSILDIATDGLAIDTLEEKERGLVNGMMWASRTLGVSLSAIFSAYCLGQYGLNQTMIFIGLIVLTLSIFPILQLENP